MKLSEDDTKEYAEEFHALKLTGRNIGIGLEKHDFLNHVNIPFGHVLELESRFIHKSKPNSTSIQRSSIDKVPRPTIGIDTSQLKFDQFQFEWNQYKQYCQLTVQEAATSLFFCCTDEVRSQIRVLQTPGSDPSTWTEEQLMSTIKDAVLSKTSPIVHIKQFLGLKQESNETCQAFLHRLQSKASCCHFVCKTCGTNNSESRVREKFILGLNDVNIQRSALKTESITPGTPLAKLLTEAITLEQSISDQRKLSSPSTSTEICSIDDGSADESSLDVNAVSKHKTKPKNK